MKHLTHDHDASGAQTLPPRPAVCRAYSVCTALWLALVPGSLHAATASAPEPRPDRFVEAVQSFAEVALQHGRDTYGPKHTPLFVDGINMETHAPVMWRSRDGHPWVLSDLGNQQIFFRTLVGLSVLTGDPRYKQSAVAATRYALTNLMAKGLHAWGGHMAYNASEDVTVCAEDKGRVHELKCHYPPRLGEIRPRRAARLAPPCRGPAKPRIARPGLHRRRRFLRRRLRRPGP